MLQPVLVVPLYMRDDESVFEYFEKFNAEVDAYTRTNIILALAESVREGDASDVIGETEGQRYPGLTEDQLPCLWVEDGNDHFTIRLPDTRSGVKEVIRRLSTAAGRVASFAELRDEIRKQETQAAQSEVASTRIYTESVMVESRTINVGDGSTIVGSVVMADKIEGSFTQLSGSAVNDDLEHLLKQLLTQIAAAGSALSSESADQLARDAKALTDEVTGPDPRRRWYELSLEGIREAAIAIGDIGKPILETTAKLLPLLIKLFP